MNPTTILALVTTIALSTSVIIGAMSFIANHAYAASCKRVDHKEIVCKASPNEVCTHYAPNQVVCTNRNFQNMPYTT